MSGVAFLFPQCIHTVVCLDTFLDSNGTAVRIILRVYTITHLTQLNFLSSLLLILLDVDSMSGQLEHDIHSSVFVKFVFDFNTHDMSSLIGSSPD